LTTGDPARILLVEDSADDILFLGRAFRKAGVPPFFRAISDGADAMGYFRGEGVYADRSTHPLPTHLILDLKLPKVSGLELLAWLRAGNSPDGLRISILSSSAEPADRETVYALGVDAYFLKPAGPGELVNTVLEIARLWGLSAGSVQVERP
jgi:DNA-binding response OmpR family regulator